MSDGQRAYIEHLLDTRSVSSAFASRLIAELLLIPERNASGLENLFDNLTRENT